MKPAQLTLASGEIFAGYSPAWQTGIYPGEVVFNTGMVGYMEAMTDPSYFGQILVFTYPLIGNYGVDPMDLWESDRVQVAGIIVSEIAPFHSRTQATDSLIGFCEKNNIPLMTGVDTRALTKCLRTKGVIAGAMSQPNETIKSFPDINAEHLVKKVSIDQPQTYGQGEKTVILVDCGLKLSILRHLERYPVKIKRVPFDYDFTGEAFDGVCLSNGPGDPTRCTETIAIIRKLLTQDKPIFGICLGSQLLSLALGAETYKLPFGHRSQNHPCLEHKTDRCYLTTQNHGYAINVETLPADWEVTFTNLNDQSVQGIAHKTKPFVAVQFHPEAGPGPVDTAWMFDQFIEAVNLVTLAEEC